MSEVQGGEQSNQAGGGGETVWDRLQGLLEKQLALVHQGSLAAAEELCNQTNQCVSVILSDSEGSGPRMGGSSNARVRSFTPLRCVQDDRQVGPQPGACGSADQWQRIERLYKDLCLALAAQRTETSDALSTIRQGKRVLRTYGNHLSSR